MKKTKGILGGFLIFLCSSYALSEPLAFERSKVLNISGFAEEKNIQIRMQRQGPGVVFEHRVANEDAGYTRFRFVIPPHTAAQSGWSLVVNASNDGSNYRNAWQLHQEDIEENRVWSDEIAGTHLKVQLVIAGENSGALLVLDRIAQSRESNKPLSIVGEDDRQPIGAFPDNIKQIGRSVAKIRFIGDDNNIYDCTGFMLSGELMLTNEHCISSESERQSAIVAFDYDTLGSHETLAYLSKIEKKNVALDYSVVRLRNAVDRPALQLATEQISDNSRLIIIQHPGGETKQVSAKDCLVGKGSVVGRSEQKTDFTHSCDTLGGSSGAPVIHVANNQVVGLHHLGFDESSAERLNRAVHIKQIMADIPAELVGMQ